MLLKKFKHKFYVSFCCFAAACFTLVFVPLLNTEATGSERTKLYAVAGAFWAFVILGIVFLLLTGSLRKSIDIKLKKENIKPEGGGIGLISFFKNKEAIISDIALFVFAIINAVFAVTGMSNAWLNIVCIVFLFIALVCHSFFNGRNYKYVKYINQYYRNKERQDNE